MKAELQEDEIDAVLSALSTAYSATQHLIHNQEINEETRQQAEQQHNTWARIGQRLSDAQTVNYMAQRGELHGSR
jgi:hypothetical protein